MHFQLDPAIALLERTPAALDALLRGLPEAWTLGNEGDGTWCALDIVGHLVHGERADWIPRAHMILTFGETRTFEPFDRTGHLRETQGKSMPQLLDEFARLRTANLIELRRLGLDPRDLILPGRHPAFGTVTLAQLLATWTVHDLTHLHQLARVLAHQYRDQVGPWSAYLGVLHCNGHGS
jgi:hypothetical protein